MTTNHLLDQVKGCLLGLAIGDALGMPTEVGPSRQRGQSISEALGVEKVTSYMDSPNPNFLKAGQYTDDTQMMIKVAETFLEGEGDFKGEIFLKKIAEIREDQRGIGPSTLAVLRSVVRDGVAETLKKDLTGTSPSNGAAMRTAPVAILFYWDLKKLKEMTVKVARFTHAHPKAIAGACVMSYLTASLLRDPDGKRNKKETLAEISAFVQDLDPELAQILLQQRKGTGTGCGVVDTVPEVIYSFLDNPHHYRDPVLRQVNSEGDTDTKASMLGSLLGLKNGLQIIPKDFQDGLENGKKGREYILKVANQLYALSQKLKSGPPDVKIRGVVPNIPQGEFRDDFDLDDD